MTGPLKLAIKYQADTLRKRIISHLEYCWPTNLCDWDSVAPQPAVWKDTADTESADDYSDFCPDPVPFIALARECNLRDILATIFYSLCCESKLRMKKLSRLRREDLETLMLGRERMMNYICGPAARQLEIPSWEIEESERYHGDVLVCCRGESYARNLHEYMKAHCDDMQNDDWDDDRYRSRPEMCIWCQREDGNRP